MSQEEFKEKVDEMFKGYEIYMLDHHLPNSYLIKDEIFLSFITYIGETWFYLFNNKTIERIYDSDFCDDFEKLYDDLIIFKELILPKYL